MSGVPITYNDSHDKFSRSSDHQIDCKTTGAGDLQAERSQAPHKGRIEEEPAIGATSEGQYNQNPGYDSSYRPDTSSQRFGGSGVSPYDSSDRGAGTHSDIPADFGRLNISDQHQHPGGTNTQSFGGYNNEQAPHSGSNEAGYGRGSAPFTGDAGGVQTEAPHRLSGTDQNSSNYPARDISNLNDSGPIHHTGQNLTSGYNPSNKHDYTSRHQTGVEPGYGTEAPYNSANQETAAAPYTSEHLPGQPTHQQHQNSSLNPTRNNDNDSAPGAYESGLGSGLGGSGEAGSKYGGHHHSLGRATNPSPYTADTAPTGHHQHGAHHRSGINPSNTFNDNSNTYGSGYGSGTGTAMGLTGGQTGAPNYSSSYGGEARGHPSAGIANPEARTRTHHHGSHLPEGNNRYNESSPAAANYGTGYGSGPGLGDGAHTGHTGAHEHPHHTSTHGEDASPYSGVTSHPASGTGPSNAAYGSQEATPAPYNDAAPAAAHNASAALDATRGLTGSNRLEGANAGGMRGAHHTPLAESNVIAADSAHKALGNVMGGRPEAAVGQPQSMEGVAPRVQTQTLPGGYVAVTTTTTTPSRAANTHGNPSAGLTGNYGASTHNNYHQPSSTAVSQAQPGAANPGYGGGSVATTAGDPYKGRQEDLNAGSIGGMHPNPTHVSNVFRPGSTANTSSEGASYAEGAPPPAYKEGKNLSANLPARGY